MTTEIAQFISPVFFFYYSGVIFWSGVLSYQIILFVRREALTKCNAYDFSFAKLAQAAFWKGRAPRLA